MNPGIKLRLIIFFTTTTLLVMLITWTAHTSWQQIGGLHEKLTTVQWKSFEFSDHLQQTILGLNNSVLRYAAYRDPDDWHSFDLGSQQRLSGRGDGHQHQDLREPPVHHQAGRVHRF
jgi:hypothetical protein